jgi:hypothetical protein
VIRLISLLFLPFISFYQYPQAEAPSVAECVEAKSTLDLMAKSKSTPGADRPAVHKLATAWVILLQFLICRHVLNLKEEM